MRVLVTGATGYVGRHICARLIADGHHVTALGRDGSRMPAGAVPLVHDLSTGPAAGEYDVTVHCAGEVRPSVPDAPLDACMNVRLARNAALTPTGRFLALSSISASVYEVIPKNARRYGAEKRAAEAVVEATLPKGIPCVFLRPPAVYGPLAAGPLSVLAKQIAKGRPLPLKGANAPRPYLSINNLSDLVATMVNAPIGVWSTAHLSRPEPHDGTLVGTAELCRMIGEITGRPARLFRLPTGLLRGLGKLAGKPDLIAGAFDAVPLRYDGIAVRHWGWSPTEAMPDSLRYLRP